MKVPFYGHIKQYHAIREELDRNSQLVSRVGQGRCLTSWILQWKEQF
jgi:hypothetical protein